MFVYLSYILGVFQNAAITIHCGINYLASYLLSCRAVFVFNVCYQDVNLTLSTVSRNHVIFGNRL